MKTATKTARVLLAALLLVPYVTPFVEQLEPSALAQAAGVARKISSDLQDKLNHAGALDRVRVIVQTPAAPSNALLTSARISGGAIAKTYLNLRCVTLALPAAAVSALANRSDVRYVSLDRATKMTGHLETTTGAALARSSGGDSHDLTTATINGSGIGIAVLDTGVYSDHHSFNSGRVVASVDFTGEGRTDDPFGHGTHVASIAAGNDHVASGKFTGIAPAANVINVRVLDSNGRGATSNALSGVDWCITNRAAYNIRVLNLSFGTTAVDSYANDPLCQAVRQAFDAGLVVCVAAGNLGKDSDGRKIYGAIHSPGIEPSAITVGAANTFGTDSRSDDGVTTYSSRGPTTGYTTDASGQKHYDHLIKPDLVAPGNKIIAAQSPNNQLVRDNPSLDAHVSDNVNHNMMYLSGSSMATPAVAGAAALLLERNPALTPNLVKAILEYTAQPLAGFNTLEQGAGELNIEGAVRVAGLIRKDLSWLTKGDPLLVGAAPARSSTIAGFQFVWGCGLIQKWNFIYGDNLCLLYQGIYGTAILLTDGVYLSDGALVRDGSLLDDSTLLSNGSVTSDGSYLCDGTHFMDGVQLADGTYLTDGVQLTDGTVFSDSYMDGSTSASAASAMAQAAMSGDSTGCMPAYPDPNPLN